MFNLQETLRLAEFVLFVPGLKKQSVSPFKGWLILKLANFIYFELIPREIKCYLIYTI